ncbi:MAG: hypothetical protein J3K34DRAFT_415752 [Monoraphidium minutum]|nr:MAG: hypothetical protein J3K34DRAFT_415752 [Monoraphidium minutum]
MPYLHLRWSPHLEMWRGTSTPGCTLAVSPVGSGRGTAAGGRAPHGCWRTLAPALAAAAAPRQLGAARGGLWRGPREDYRHRDASGGWRRQAGGGARGWRRREAARADHQCTLQPHSCPPIELPAHGPARARGDQAFWCTRGGGCCTGRDGTPSARPGQAKTTLLLVRHLDYWGPGARPSRPIPPNHAPPQTRGVLSCSCARTLDGAHPGFGSGPR